MSEEVPQWARDRMVRYCEEIDERPSEAFARYIATHEQPPVDPDVIAMDEAIRRYNTMMFNAGNSHDDAVAAALERFREHKEAGK